jgi:hypothetical protein
MFSTKFKSDRPVALIEDSAIGNKLIYVHTDYPANSPPSDYFDRLILESGHMQIIPEQRLNQTDRICLASASGCGKSTWICSYIHEFYHMFPNAPKAILFTLQDSLDPAFDPIKDKLVLVTLDDDIIEEPIDLNELSIFDKHTGTYKPSLIIMDDVESAPSKLQKCIDTLRNVIACNLRKKRVYLIYSSTQVPIKNGSFRDFLGNTTGLVIWPKFPPLNIKYLLESHYGINKEVWKIIRDKRDRWVMLRRVDAPLFIITDTTAYIFDQDREEDVAKEKKMLRAREDKIKFSMLLNAVNPSNS